MKRSFFQAAVASILLYGCTTWTQTKRLEKKLDGNYTRMLRAILNKSWRQHPTRHQLYGHLPPIMKTIQVRWTRHAGHCWRIRNELISDVLLWTPTYGQAKAGWPARTYIQQLCEDTDVVQKTCQRRWTIGKSGERGSGISMLAARHDDDDDDDISLDNFICHISWGISVSIVFKASILFVLSGCFSWLPSTHFVFGFLFIIFFQLFKFVFSGNLGSLSGTGFWLDQFLLRWLILFIWDFSRWSCFTNCWRGISSLRWHMRQWFYLGTRGFIFGRVEFSSWVQMLFFIWCSNVCCASFLKLDFRVWVWFFSSFIRLDSALNWEFSSLSCWVLVVLAQLFGR